MSLCIYSINPITRRSFAMSNSINSLLSDSYKYTHFNMYPSDMTSMYSYIESRGGMYPETLFFGMRNYLTEYLSKPFSKADLDLVDEIITEHMPTIKFNRAGWDHILNKHGGHLPLRIRSVKEGTVVPTRNVLVTAESTDPVVPWVVGHVETTMLRMWYPTTVATRSMFIKRIIESGMRETADGESMAGLPYMLHDFGMRGAPGSQAAGISGAAHLINFVGTDNVDALMYLNNMYGRADYGRSIAATEHTIMTSYGRNNEIEPYLRAIDVYGFPGAIISIVGDSYDIFNVCDHILPQLKDKIIVSGARLVLRPDSGDPLMVLPRILKSLEKTFGTTINSKGYKVLHPCIRVIWGDGINESSIMGMIDLLKSLGFSVENIVFGCGGYLLQGLTRDTNQFAMKSSSVNRNGIWVDVSKDPVTDHSKRSRSGRVTLYRNNEGVYHSGIITGEPDELVTTYENGEIMNLPSFDDVRATAASWMVA